MRQPLVLLGIAVVLCWCGSPRSTTCDPACAGCCDSAGACLPLSTCSAGGGAGGGAAVDAGADAAVTVDAGLDAGAPDAGQPDAGFDAGAPADAGVDGGAAVDAGTPDAGPPGETCLNAQPLSLTRAHATATGTLVGYADDYMSPGCHAASGPDHVYSLTLASPQVITITVTSTAFAPAVSLRGPTAALSCASSVEVACADAITPATVTTSLLQPGTYFLMVESADQRVGAFTVAVDRISTALPGDTCAAPLPLDLSAGSVSVSGTTVGATSDVPSGGCGTFQGGDFVYEVTLAEGEAITATVTPSSTLWPEVAFAPASTCTSSRFPLVGAGCAFKSGPGLQVTYSSAPQHAGSYDLWVAAADGLTGGTYTLAVAKVAAVPPGSCSFPIETAVGSSPVVVQGATAGVSMVTSTCLGGGLGEQVYLVTLATAATFTATVDTTTPTYRPIVTVRDSCTAATDLACAGANAPGASATVTTTLPVGVHYVIVDGANQTGTTNGSYTLTMTAQ